MAGEWRVFPSPAKNLGESEGRGMGREKDLPRYPRGDGRKFHSAFEDERVELVHLESDKKPPAHRRGRVFTF